MSPEAREHHKVRTRTKRARAANPQPFKWARGERVADWMRPAFDCVWPYVFAPEKFSDLEKINNLFRAKSRPRRIAIALVTQVMIYCKDTLTLWVAYPDKKKGWEVVTGRGVDFLMEKTGLTLCAVRGALKDMGAAGLIQTFRRHRRLPDRRVVPANAIRLVRANLFEAFGIAHLMNKARKAAANKLIDEVAPLIAAGKSIASWLLARFEVAQRILLDPAREVSPTSALLP